MNTCLVTAVVVALAPAARTARCAAVGPEETLRARITIARAHGQPASWTDVVVVGKQEDAAAVCAALLERELRRTYPRESGLVTRVDRGCEASALPALPEQGARAAFLQWQLVDPIEATLSAPGDQCLTEQWERVRAQLRQISMFSEPDACLAMSAHLEEEARAGRKRGAEVARSWLIDTSSQVERERDAACADPSSDRCATARMMLEVIGQRITTGTDAASAVPHEPRATCVPPETLTLDELLATDGGADWQLLLRTIDAAVAVELMATRYGARHPKLRFVRARLARLSEAALVGTEDGASPGGALQRELKRRLAALARADAELSIRYLSEHVQRRRVEQERRAYQRWLDRLGPSQSASASTSSDEHPSVASSYAQFLVQQTRARGRLDYLTARYTERHPLVVEARLQVKLAGLALEALGTPDAAACARAGEALRVAVDEAGGLPERDPSSEHAAVADALLMECGRLHRACSRSR